MPKELHHKLQSKPNTGISVSFDFASLVSLRIFYIWGISRQNQYLTEPIPSSHTSCQHTQQWTVLHTNVYPWIWDKPFCQVQPLLVARRTQFVVISVSFEVFSLKWTTSSRSHLKFSTQNTKQTSQFCQSSEQMKVLLIRQCCLQTMLSSESHWWRSMRLATPSMTWKVEKGNSQHPILYQSVSSNKEAEGPNNSNSQEETKHSADLNFRLIILWYGLLCE